MLRGLVVRRKLPQGVCAGDLLLAGVTVTNPRPRLGSWAVVVEDSVVRQSGDEAARAAGGHNGATADAAVLFPYVPAGEIRKGVYQGRIAGRGHYRFGPLRIATRFPFGLLRDRIALGSAASLTVLPRRGRLTPRLDRPAAGRSPAPTAASRSRAAKAISTACVPGSAAIAGAGSTGGLRPAWGA